MKETLVLPLSSSAYQQSDHPGQRVRRTKVPRSGSIGAVKKYARQSESDVQRDIIAYIEAVVPRCLIFAVPNASRRTRGGRATNGVPGLKRGIFDLCFVAPGGFVGFLEVKRPNGPGLSEHQEEIRGRFVSLATPHAVVRSVDDVRVALKHWNITTREVSHEQA